jgi:Mrp family chromosome partitioning ATPase
LLAGPAALALFTALRAEFDLVLIDSPPVLPVTDATVLSKDSDGVLLVLAAGQTRRADVRRATEKLAQVNATMMGTILNEVTRQTGDGYGNGYGYGYGYGAYGYGTEEPSLSPAAITASANGIATASANGAAPAGVSNGASHRHRAPRTRDAQHASGAERAD